MKLEVDENHNFTQGGKPVSAAMNQYLRKPYCDKHGAWLENGDHVTYDGREFTFVAVRSPIQYAVIDDGSVYYQVPSHFLEKV